MKKSATKIAEEKTESEPEKSEQRRAHRRNLPKPITREEMKAASEESKAPSEKAPEVAPVATSAPTAPKPIDYTEMMMQRRPRRMGGGFVGRWR